VAVTVAVTAAIVAAACSGSWRDYLGDTARNMWKPTALQLLLLAALWATGHPAVYLARIGAYLTTYSLFMQIRSMSEPACTEESTDMLRNTRTTRAGLLARATVAPLRVNHHIERHQMPAVPYFQLPALHGMLRERGLVAPPPGYLDVLRIVCAPRA
jgi:fatty acid desaturase